MPRISNFEIIKQMKTHTLSIREITEVKNLPALIGKSYEAIKLYIKNELHEHITDVPFVIYHNLDMENLDVEMCFPVSEHFQGKGSIKAGSIEESLAVFCIYIGAYQDIGHVYNDMAKWIEQNKHDALGISYEYYYNDLSFPENELLTKIVMPLKK